MKKSKKNKYTLEDRESAATELAKNIRNIMKGLEITQTEFSEITKLRQGQVSEIIRGFRPNLSWFVLYQIADSLDTSMESLIKGTYNLKKIKKHLDK